jgi:hypothetical protein
MQRVLVVQFQLAEIGMGAEVMLRVLRGDFGLLEHTHGVATSPSVQMIAEVQHDMAVGLLLRRRHGGVVILASGTTPSRWSGQRRAG